MYIWLALNQSSTKKISIPWLELCRESSMLLGYMRSVTPPFCWVGFVRQPIALKLLFSMGQYIFKIGRPSSWNYIRFENNPDDVVSRGTSFYFLWAYFLVLCFLFSLYYFQLRDDTVPEEEKRVLLQNLVGGNNFLDELLYRISSFSVLEINVVRVIRAVHNFKILDMSSRYFGPLTSNELLILVTRTQDIYFSKEFFGIIFFVYVIKCIYRW